MSDIAIAIAVVPFLVALTIMLECGRVGCTWLSRKLRASRPERSDASHRRGRPERMQSR